ncbi:aminotransferase class V-fold PLP-dependent enzyme [Candidatus Poseidonia alphae]|nr:aminotransferase class V-fold PLP-dependent enzyme [Candidatus Poseidonia alphae]MDA8638874.1 aminotransferase class V-fold PLP-dependent enzyme [Candidatus Poseidonia alphae]
METSMDTEAFINEIASRLVHYIGSKDKKERVNPELGASSLKRVLDVSVPLEGMGINTVLDDLDTFMANSVKTHRAEFMNPLWGGLSLPALAGEIIASATNNSMYTFELSPIATLIEQTVLKRMCEIVGFPDGFGTLTTGGSNGNMIGMLCAREHVLPGSTKTGFDGSKMVAFVSAESHYSVLMAANVIGIGHQNVVKVRCDEDGCMRPESLREEIEFAVKEGLTPFCVVATSGTTVRGAFDPLNDLAEIAHEHDLWLHVDAAWGGTCMFSPTHRKLMDGIQKADSICWDAHKMMGLPLICSTFLIKKPQVLRTLCGHANVAHYLFLDDAEYDDLGRYSLQCGRRNDALKLWLEWRVRGDAGWSKMVDQYMDHAAHLESSVREHPSLELMSSRMWTNVCFRYAPEGTEMDLNELNGELRNRLIQEGVFMVSRSNIGDDVILRPVISNQNVTVGSIDRFVETVLRHGDEILRGLPSMN